MSCEETYEQCMEDRRARVVAVIQAAEPWETNKDLAAKAGVSERTLERVKASLQMPTPDGDCNKPAKVKLSDLYRDDVPYWTHRKVKAVEAALQECSREQLAYLFSEVLPIFHISLVRKESTS